MKKHFYLLLSFLFVATFSFGQLTFSDDFESYADGDHLGAVSPDWTTWSGTVGTTEDADVVEGVSLSGTKSIRFAAGTTDGPQDVVLPFGAQYTEGQFNFSMNILVEEGTGAYFNFQGQTTIGVDWVTQVWFEADNVIRIQGSTNGQTEASSTYEFGEWINIAYEINLTSNTWNISIDGECVGSWTNELNAVASLDLFPLAGNTFYVDDVSFSYEPEAEIPAVDLAIGSVDLRPAGITGQEKSVSGSVKNNGTEAITSFDMTITDGITMETESYSGLSIAAGDDYAFMFAMPYMIKEGQTEVEVYLSNVNGAGADEDPCNDASKSIITGVTPAPDKRVLAEEATGTWCTWCPRGAVFLDLMTDEYGSDYFVGVAVHNGDPMAVLEHDDGLTSTPGFTGFPSVVMEREEVIDPSAIELAFLNRLTIPPVATIENGAEYDPNTDELTVSVTANAVEDFSGDYRLNVIIVEDGVTGTGSGYNQVNAYAGGANGPMGGYENLPNPVPASQMVYDHVSRAILGSYSGVLNSLPDAMTAGDSHSYLFNVVVSEEWELDKLKIVGFLIAPDGTVDNAFESTLEEAIEHGLAVSTEEIITNAAIETFPNPFNEELNINLDLDETVTVSTRMYNAAGTLVATQEYGQLNGKSSIQMSTNDLAEGMYILNIVLDNQIVVKKVTLMK